MCCGRSSKKARRSKGRARIKKSVASDIQVQSLGLKMGKFLLCQPEFYGINYSINPWMNVANGADKNKAIEQWNSLRDKIKELDAEVELVKPIDGLPDMVFTANAALITKEGKVIVSHFAHKERSQEEQYFAQWFVDNGYEVIHTSYLFEGAGDALQFGDVLICGHGFRSDISFYTPIN